MELTYGALKSADQNGNRVGNWKGRPVFASSKNGLKNRGTGVYYIVYDDNNVIVRRNEDNGKWFKYGWAAKDGRVNEETVAEYINRRFTHGDCALVYDADGQLQSCASP